jgi:hypothetical protein
MAFLVASINDPEFRPDRRASSPEGKDIDNQSRTAPEGTKVGHFHLE